MTPRHWFVLAALSLAPVAAFAQRPVNEHHVVPGVNVQDKGEIATLHFDFKDPRMLEVNIPGRGRTVVWYMCYWVSNFSKQPFTLYPDFILLTNRNTVHHDEVLPEVFEKIRQEEDRNNRFNFQNSVTISQTPIPVSKPDALPRRVAGIAIWAMWSTDTTKPQTPEQKRIDDMARTAASFRIFVNGLSNGWAIDDDGRISRKTLRLEFDRRGDGSRLDSTEIVYRGVAKWDYRDASSADVDLKRPTSLQPAAAAPAPMKE